MKQNIQKKMVELFNQLGKPQKKIVNDWIIREKSVANVGIFLGDESTPDTDGQELCVMLKKALDADDFSGFTGEAPKPAKKPAAKKAAPQEKVTVHEVSPKLAVVHVGSEPEPSTTPEIDKIEVELPPEPEAPILHAEPESSRLVGAVIDLIKAHAPAPTSGSPTPAAAPAPTAAALSEDRVREIIKEEMAEYFKRLLP